MTALQRYRLVKFIRFFVLQLCGPVITAIVIWGALKEPGELTWFDRVGIGTIIAAFVVVTILGDYLKEVFEQMKLDKKVAFSKNRAVLFLVVGGVLYLLQNVGHDAMWFFLISGACHALAYGVEIIEKKIRPAATV
jgi:hypothetical protein